MTAKGTNKEKCQFPPYLCPSEIKHRCVADMKEVEQYGQGYPRLAAFLLLAKEFTVVKRFDYLHMRSILELQDELAELQDQLHKCDDTEPIRLNLSSRRHDSNLERRRIMKQIHSKLSTYGQLFSLFS